MRPRTARAFIALIILSGLIGVLGQLTGGCAQTPVSVPVRSLERSGKVSFVCLEPPWFDGTVQRPLSDCTSQQFTSECQYLFENDAGVIDAGSGTLPHLYALVTQTARGEVAVIDTSTSVNSVLDENPLEPGANFLPIGALPTGIVSTPGGVATFVGVADPKGPGLFALPSTQIRPASVGGVPDLCLAGSGDSGVEVVPTYTSWPACSLPVAPGDIILVNDPYIVVPKYRGQELVEQRVSCDSDYHPNGDKDFYNATTDPISFVEDGTTNEPGRPKLVMTLPELGGIAVIDAQELLTRQPNAFAPCTVERWLPLEVNPSDIASLAGVSAPPTGAACGNAAPATPPLLLGTPCQSDGDCGGIAGSCSGGSCKYTARLGGMSYSPDTHVLYVADVGAPLIHVVDLSHVCSPVERPPLLPTSAEVPQRVVFASRVAVSPQPTPDAKLYLYATDVDDASAMVFDVTITSTSRQPLQRQHPEWNPFQPRDRVKFPAPPADIIIVQHELPDIDIVSGTAPGGALCDPNPNAVTCVATDTNCDLGANYRTSTDYTLGAGPQKLRGQFAFAALTSGRVSVIDIADFDAPCRGPVSPSLLAGCTSDGNGALVTSKEISCNVVSQTIGEVRDSNYEGVGTLPGNHVPGIQTYPQLYNNDGSVFVPTATVTPPMMVATLPEDTYPPTGPVSSPGCKPNSAGCIPAACLQPCDPSACGETCDTLPGCPLQLFVGGTQTPLDLKSGQCSTTCEPAGAQCNGSADCCGGNVCYAKTCQSDADCAAGVTCNTTTHQCVTRVCAPATCTADGPACVPISAADPACNAKLCTSSQKWDAVSVHSSFTPGAIGANNSLAMNLEDPRAQIADQNWSVIYEGAIPGFAQRSAPLAVPATGPKTLTDANSRFCDAGVLGKNAMEELLAAQTAAGQPTPAGLAAADLADYVQITSDLPSPSSAYWTELATPTYSYSRCFDIFGSIDAPSLNTTRDLRIVEAYQDHVELEPRSDANFTDIQACFPTQLSFTVRVGSQWIVLGDQTGFIHHVVADVSSSPAGKCRNACDPVFARKNGRVVESPRSSLFIPDRGPGALDPSASFLNPMFRFGIFAGQKSCAHDSDCDPGNGCDQTTLVCKTKVYQAGEACTLTAPCPSHLLCDLTQLTGKKGTCYQLGQPERVSTRDAVFRFSTNGSFLPLSVALSTDPSALVEPQAVTYLAPTFELAVTDGSVNGVIFFSLQTPGVSRSFF